MAGKKYSGHRKLRYMCLSLIVLSFLMIQVLSASQVHVRVNDPVYEFLERMMVQGFLSDYSDNALPLSRDYIARQLQELDGQRSDLAVIDRKILDEYLADYRYEFGAGKHFLIPADKTGYFGFYPLSNVKKGLLDFIRYDQKQEEHHLVAFETEKEMLWLDVDMMGRAEFKNGYGRQVTQNAFRISSQVGDCFSIYSDAYIYDQQLRPEYSEMTREYQGGFTGVEERPFNITGASFDYSIAYMQYSSFLGDVEFGIEPLIWGNSPNSMILSNNVDPFTFISWQRQFGKSKFSFFHGFIKPAEATIADSTADDYMQFIKKYLVGHRWDVNISKKVKIAFSEMLVYGGRDIEAAYALPVVFLWPVQHSVTKHNYDNIIWFFEGEYYPVNHLKLYGTFLLDEVSTRNLFKNAFDCMYGPQVGFYYTPGSVFNLPLATDFRAEFTAIRPWIYNHRAPLQSSYTHNGRVLGFKGGPNSQQLFLENRWWINERQRLKLSYSVLEHGVNEKSVTDEDYYTIGDDPNESYQDRNRDYDMKTKWLMGNIIETRLFSFSWMYQLSNIIFVDLSYTRQWIDNVTDDYYALQLRFDY